MKKALYLFLAAAICLTAAACGRKAEKPKVIKSIKTADVGEYIRLGKYEQDGDKENGKEPVDWLVIDKKDNRILVISQYALDCRQYNEELEDVRWEECTLRKWLNDDFLNGTFSKEEKDNIQSVTVKAGKNPEYDTDAGKDTKDKVFLLSIDEVNKYFADQSSRVCEPTKYAVSKGAYASSDSNSCWWWLRSPGNIQTFAADVYSDGVVFGYGNYITGDMNAVRPAMWIETK